jgi:predicted alpha/beta-fold hydrolase
MYLYGVSLGANILTHYLINDDANQPYSGVATYGVPFQPDMTIAHFKNSMWGLYDIGLGFSLNLKLRELLPDLAKFSTKKQMETYRNGLYNESWRLTSIDTHFICPMFHFKDSMDYYRKSRLSGNLHKIKKCPVMFLESWDDVLMTPESFPVAEIHASPNLLLACTRSGGHCCHLTNSDRKLTGIAAIDWLAWFFPSSNWFAGPIMDFIDTIEKQNYSAKD